jgi:hypothetical protein
MTIWYHMIEQHYDNLFIYILFLFQVFHDLHIAEGAEGRYLSCNEVWFAKDLPFQSEKAYGNSSCYFSLIQSSTGISAGKLASLGVHLGSQ